MGQKTSQQDRLADLNSQLLRTARAFDGSTIPKHPKTELLVSGYVRNANRSVLEIVPKVYGYYRGTSRAKMECKMSELVRTGVQSADGSQAIVRCPLDAQTAYLLMLVKRNEPPKEQKQSKKEQKELIRRETRKTELLMNGLDILQQLDHQSILLVHRTFIEEGTNNIYILQNVGSGDIRSLMQAQKNKYLDEKTTRYYAASLIEVLSYLHSLSVMKNTILPEAMELDRRGALKLTDFEYSVMTTEASRWMAERLDGRSHYLSPETTPLGPFSIDENSDWFSLGSIIYEMHSGLLPFNDYDCIDVWRNIAEGRTVIPKHFEMWFKNLLVQLWRYEPSERLGAGENGVQQLKKHNWFGRFDWMALENGTMKPPNLAQKSVET